MAEAGEEGRQVAHGIESNMASLQVLRSLPGFLPEKVAILEWLSRRSCSYSIPGSLVLIISATRHQFAP